MDFINAQLGRIFLVSAAVIVAVTMQMNAPRPLPEVEQKELTRPVLVDLDKAELAVASSEVYFAEGPMAKYAGSERFVFVAEKKIKEFVPVLLELPPASVMRPPMILTEPGPALEGAHTLPRYGDEFPPVTVTPPDPKARGTPTPPEKTP
jgi:hypothetical protein